MPRTPRPRYRDDRGFWFAQIDGRRVILARGKKNLPAAREELRRRLAEGGRKASAPEDRLVGEVLEKRLDWILAHQRPNTAKDATWYLNQIAPTFGRARVSQLKPHQVLEWLDSKRTWSPMTRRHALTIFKAALSWGAKVGLISESPLRAMERPPVTTRPLCSGRAVLDQVLPWVRSAEFRDYLVVLAETGCRPSELSRLEAGHLRHDARAAVLVEHKTDGKTGRARAIYFTERAWPLVSARAASRPAGPLFLTAKGNPWSDGARACQLKAIRARFEAARAKLPKRQRAKTALPRFDSYSFRHGFATDALERGLTSSEVAALMGNSAAMVERVYDHLRSREPAMRAALERARPAED
jgi:integrase